MRTAEQEKPVMLSPSKAQGLEVLWGLAGLRNIRSWNLVSMEGHVAMDKLIRKRARAQDDSSSSPSLFYPSSSMLDGTLHIQGNSHAVPCVSHHWNAHKGMLLTVSCLTSNEVDDQN